MTAQDKKKILDTERKKFCNRFHYEQTSIIKINVFEYFEVLAKGIKSVVIKRCAEKTKDVL